MNVIGTLFSYEWGNPYTQPPEGLRVLAEIFVPGHCSQVPAELRALNVTLGGGYSLTITHIGEPPKRLGQAALASVRRKRLERRVRAKAPMFADQFIAQELEKKPEYYNGITDEQLQQARDQVIEQERARNEELFSRPNQLIIYGQEPAACKERAARFRAELKPISNL
jgi:hypothetical protein